MGLIHSKMKKNLIQSWLLPVAVTQYPKDHKWKELPPRRTAWSPLFLPLTVWLWRWKRAGVWPGNRRVGLSTNWQTNPELFTRSGAMETWESGGKRSWNRGSLRFLWSLEWYDGLSMEISDEALGKDCINVYQPTRESAFSVHHGLIFISNLSSNLIFVLWVINGWMFIDALDWGSFWEGWWLGCQ